MKFISSYFSKAILFASIVFLWWMRWDSLCDPYFWDEMGVYGNGLQNMLRDGVGLHPSKLPPDISRGHPLLLHVIHVWALKIFGNKLFISHVTSLLVSSLVLISTYFLAKKFLSAVFAAFAVLLLVAQPIFLAQSTLVLPEMMVTLLVILSLTCFFNRQFFLSAFICVLGILVKESFILVPAILGTLTMFWGSAQNRSINLKALWYVLPLVAFLLFIQLQFQTYGWYFFPYHTEIVQSSALSEFWIKLFKHYNFILFKQGRNQWILLIAVALLVVLFKKGDKRPLKLFLFVFFSVVIYSFAFYMDRYLLFIYPILAIIVIYGLHSLPIAGVFKILIFVFLFLATLYESNDSSFRYDVSLSYENVVKSQLKTTEFICQKKLQEGVIYADFPMNMALTDTLLSYIDASCADNIKFSWDAQQADYMILYNQNVPPQGFELKESFLEKGLGFYVYEKI